MQKASNNKFDIDFFLGTYPELKGDNVGVFNITTLQVASSFTKIGLTPILRQLVKLGRQYINIEDQLGRTPLHYAAINGNTELVQLLLESGAETECKFKYTEIRMGGSNDGYGKWNRLFMALTPPDIWGRTPLHLAAKAGHVEVVKLLIENSADVNVVDCKGITPLLLAGCIGNRNTFECIVKLLVESGADVTRRNKVTDTTALFHAVALKSSKATKFLLDAGAWITEGHCDETELHEAAANNLLEILQLFLDDKRITLENINKQDQCGRTPAYRAAYLGHKDCLKLLILKGADLASTAAIKESVLETIFLRVNKPGVFLKEIFDHGIIKDKESNRITLDFGILARSGCDSQTNIVYSIFSSAHHNEYIDILEHPLIETFLRLKWNKIRCFFYLLIVAYLIFVVTLSVYVMLLIHKFEYFSPMTQIIRYILIFSSGGLLIHGIIQSIISWRGFYKKYELWINLCCTSLALVVAVIGQKDVQSSNEKNTWMAHITSIAVLLAWTELMLLIGRFPSYGYYALMFAAVLQNVVKVLLTFICLVIGFALSFAIQFRNCEQFQTPWRALVKTTVMMMGEFEYENLFEDSKDTLPRLPTTSRLIFLMFVIVASIVLMNLMVGLAVSDIQGLTKEGNVRRLEKQAEFLHQFEKITCRIINLNIFPRFLTNLLKKKRAISTKFVVQADLFGPNRNNIFGVKRLPPELLETITNLAKRKHQGEAEIFKDINFPHLVETMKSIIKAYEARMNNQN